MQSIFFQTKEAKIKKAAEMAGLAEQMQDREQQMFVMAGLLAFTDKIIDLETANKIKEKISMNKVEWLIRQEERREWEEEKKQALAQAAKRYEMEKRQADESYKKWNRHMK